MRHHITTIPHILRNDRGSLLVVVLVMVFATTIMGFVLATMSSMDLRISGNQQEYTLALYAAEAGLAEATHRMTLRNPTVSTVSGWTGNIAISDSIPWDPDWTARIFMVGPGSAPKGAGGDFNTGTLQDLGSDPLSYSSLPGNTEEALTIRHKWVDRNDDGNRDANEIVLYDGAQNPSENFTTGYPVEVVTVTGRSGYATRTIEAELTRIPLAPKAFGALVSNNGVVATGTSQFCGYNHDVNIPDDTAPMACFAWHLADGNSPGIVTTGDGITINSTPSSSFGDPTDVDTTATVFPTLAVALGVSEAELQSILGHADFTSLPADKKVGMFGITYIKGDLSIGANRFGGGLLYVTGSAKIAGNFSWRGLVYIEGDLRVTGVAWILGALMAGGEVEEAAISGTPAILYSKDTLEDIVQYVPMMRLSWRESQVQ